MRKVFEFVIDLIMVICTLVFVHKFEIFDLFEGIIAKLTFAGVSGWLLGYHIIPYIGKHIIDTLIRRCNSTKVENTTDVEQK